MSNITDRDALAKTSQDARNRQRVAASQQSPEEKIESRPRSQQEAEAARREASGAAKDFKKQARDAGQAAAEQASGAAAEVRQSAVEAGERVREEGVAAVARQKNAAAEELEHLRDALDAAAAKLKEEGDSRVADFVHVAADRVESAASYLRDRELSRLVDDASRFARRRPEVFYGGLFMAGLAASRFLKASSDHDRRGSY